MFTFKFKVTGMGCAACERRVKTAVSALDFVKSTEIDLANGLMTVITDKEICLQEITGAVASAGYSASVL